MKRTLEWEDVPWERASCVGTDPEAFFPSVGEDRVSEQVIHVVRRICGSCEIQAECYSYGLREPFGIWGGVTAKHRQSERRRMGLTVREVPTVVPRAS